MNNFEFTRTLSLEKAVIADLNRKLPHRMSARSELLVSHVKALIDKGFRLYDAIDHARLQFHTTLKEEAAIVDAIRGSSPTAVFKE